MATVKTIPEIIQIAKMSVSIAANKVGNDLCKYGRSPDKNIHIDIYTELMAVEYLYANYPSEEFTRHAANYLYDLCFPYNRQAEVIIDNLSGTAPVVTGPSSLTVADGASASFTIVVVSTTAYTVQWYRDGVIINGATSNTYSFTADTTDSGATFFAVATNAAGSKISATATLTVTTAQVGHYYIGDTNYSANLLIGFDNVVWLGTFDIEEGEPISVDVPSAGDLGNNKNHVYRYPKTLGLYNGAWSSGTLNFGNAIPDQAWIEIIEIGDYYYIVSRDQISCDPSQPMIFNLG